MADTQKKINQMDNPRHAQMLNELVNTKFKYEDEVYYCTEWQDWEDSRKVQIVTNNGFLPEVAYRRLDEFFQKIVRLPKENNNAELPASANNNHSAPAAFEEEPVMPPLVLDVLNRQNDEAKIMSGILLNVAAELEKGAATQNTIERAKTVSLLATSLTNQHKAQTSGIAEVAKLFYQKGKGAPKSKKGNDDQPNDAQPKE